MKPDDYNKVYSLWETSEEIGINIKVNEVDLLAYTENKNGNIFWSKNNFVLKNELSYRRKNM